MEALSIEEIAQAVGGRILQGDRNYRITSVSTNSKNLEPGALFVPIVGEKVDAHDYIDDAFANGAAACFTSRPETVLPEHIYIAVEDTLAALQALGSWYRGRFSVPVIGITGSVGKTTTKEMVAAAFMTGYNVLKTEGNMNSQIGLPLMMLRLNPCHQIAVIEMGMSEEGEMAKLTAIAKPEAAIMTNIGVSHIGQLKTKENIRKEKLNIINAFGEHSKLYINGNDTLLADIYYSRYPDRKDSSAASRSSFQAESGQKAGIDISAVTAGALKNADVVAFGTESFCGYRAEDIRMKDGKTYFNLVTDHGNEEEIELQVLGIHNVYNALAALAAAEQYGIPASVAKEGLRLYQPIAMRGQILELNQVKIIDDSYNASPDSMKSGIQVLMELEGVTRRIAVLADVLELGEQSYQCHYEVGTYIAGQKVDEVVTVGSEAAYIAQAIQDKNPAVVTHSFQRNEEASAYLKSTVRAGDAVLVKGSRSMRTDEIVRALSGGPAQQDIPVNG